jgi:hypothetical protein
MEGTSMKIVERCFVATAIADLLLIAATLYLDLF